MLKRCLTLLPPPSKRGARRIGVADAALTGSTGDERGNEGAARPGHLVRERLARPQLRACHGRVVASPPRARRVPKT